MSAHAEDHVKKAVLMEPATATPATPAAQAARPSPDMTGDAFRLRPDDAQGGLAHLGLNLPNAINFLMEGQTLGAVEISARGGGGGWHAARTADPGDVHECRCRPMAAAIRWPTPSRRGSPTASGTSRRARASSWLMRSCTGRFACRTARSARLKIAGKDERGVLCGGAVLALPAHF